MQGEAAQCAVEHTRARQDAAAAGATARDHAVGMEAALRQDYAQLIGGRHGLAGIDAVRVREASLNARCAQLASVARTAAEAMEHAAAMEAVARERLAEAACNVARREHLHGAVSRAWAQLRQAQDELRQEDGHAALHAWRG